MSKKKTVHAKKIVLSEKAVSALCRALENGGIKVPDHQEAFVSKPSPLRYA